MATGAPRGAGSDSTAVTNFSTYGMGWIVQDYRHALVWEHSGGTLGMTSQVGMLPERRFGVVVLSNMASASLPLLIQNYVFDRELGAPVRDLSGEAYARSLQQRRRADSVDYVLAAAHPPDARPPLPLAAYAGIYVDSVYGVANVTVKDGRLELQRGEWHAPLQYWNAVNFRWTLPGAATGPLFIKFEVSPDNTVTGLYFGLGADIALLTRKGGRRGS